MEKIFLDVAGQTAAVAGDYKANALGVAYVGLNGSLAHHDNIRVAKLLCNIFCHVKTVARTGIAENYVFTHGRFSFVFIESIVYQKLI